MCFFLRVHYAMHQVPEIRIPDECLAPVDAGRWLHELTASFIDGEAHNRQAPLGKAQVVPVSLTDSFLKEQKKTKKVQNSSPPQLKFR
jgi:hypothetical protein